MQPTSEFWLNIFSYVLLNKTSEEVCSPKKQSISLECKEEIRDPNFLQKVRHVLDLMTLDSDFTKLEPKYSVLGVMYLSLLA